MTKPIASFSLASCFSGKGAFARSVRSRQHNIKDVDTKKLGFHHTDMQGLLKRIDIDLRLFTHE